MNRIGRERGWPPSGRREYEALRGPRAALNVGAPEQVAEKILYEHELFAMDRYVGQMSVGAVDHAAVMRSIELFGSEVAPLVRAELAKREQPAAGAPPTAPRATRSRRPRRPRSAAPDPSICDCSSPARQS